MKPALGVQHASVNGALLEYLELGTGSAVVFVHGAPSDYRTWLPHCSILASGYRTITYSQRYFGSSEWQQDWASFGIRAHADDLVTLLRRLDAAPAHMVAWSYGGHVALTAACEQPALFASLFVYEPGVPTYVTDEKELAAAAEDGNAMFGAVFQAVQSGDNEAAVRALLDGSGGSPGYFESQPTERQRVQLDNARVVPLLLSQSAPPQLSCADLQSVRVPVCIAWGERTRPFFGVVARAAARCIGGTAHMQIPSATHMWPEEQPAKFAATVQRWIG